MRSIHLKSELGEEVLKTGGLAVTLGGLGLVLLLEDLLESLTSVDASGLGDGCLVNGLLQVDIDSVSVEKGALREKGVRSPCCLLQ